MDSAAELAQQRLAVTPRREDRRVNAHLFLALLAVLGAALASARLVGTRRQRRLISDLKLLLLGAVLLLSPGTIQTAATLEAETATERLQVEAKRFADWFKDWYREHWLPSQAKSDTTSAD
jgi:hypothetical protein